VGFVDIKPRVGDPAVRALITYAVGYPTDEKVDRVIVSYTTNAERRLLGFEKSGNVCGYVGYEVVEPGHALIQHIAVEPATRRQGIGRLMVQWILTAENVWKVSAETDGNAVGFYQRCGFHPTRFEHSVYRVERFRCELVVGHGC
jgi:ribosomal protein S18 acetylase RimI-like enzyme